MIRRIALAGLLVGGFAVAASAALNPIETRKNLMKSVGASAKAAGDMVKGEVPYDAARAQLAMRTMYGTAVAFPHLLPDDSKTGGETEASPRIWENKADFNAKMEKFARDAWAAIGPAGQGLDGLKAAFQTVSANCKGCHETYRIQK